MSPVQVLSWENTHPRAIENFGRFGASVSVETEGGFNVPIAEARSDVSELDAIAHAISQACNAIRDAPRRKLK